MKKIQQIFLSYVRNDKKDVEHLYKRLSEAGFKPWMDKRDVIAGELWKYKIQKAIRNSDFFLACLSSHAVNKRGFLQKEIKNALDIWQEKLPDDIYLIPVRLEECEVPDTLSDFQWVDLFEEGGWTKLIEAIMAGIERRFEDTAVEIPSESPPDEGLVHKGLFEDMRPKLPIVTFPDEVCKYMLRIAPKAWQSLSTEHQRFIATLGTKLEPIVQIVPPTPTTLVLGFENLALGSLGENFSEIERFVPDLDPSLIRMVLALVALKTTSLLRNEAIQNGKVGARHLLFSLNLDPTMLESSYLEDLFDRYLYLGKNNIIFEISEKTAFQYLDRLKQLQVDFDLHFSADDFNKWNPKVKNILKNRIEMTKIDYKTFIKIMAVRGESHEEAIKRISAHKIKNKPLIVEGVENQNYMRFLNLHWPFDTLGYLYGQGYVLCPGYPWNAWTSDLRGFGLPGGHFLFNKAVSQ